MKLIVNRNLKQNNYEVALEIVDIGEEDKELFHDFGEFIVNVGGKITKEVTSVIEEEIEKTDDEGNPILDGEGNPEIELIEKEITETVELADLGNAYRKFPSEFPVKRVFTKAEFDEEAEEIAKLYIEKIRKEIEEKLVKLRENRDSFSKIEEYRL